MPRNICAFSEIVVACGQWPYFNIGTCSRALARTHFVVRVELRASSMLGSGSVPSLWEAEISVHCHVVSISVWGEAQKKSCFNLQKG